VGDCKQCSGTGVQGRTSEQVTCRRCLGRCHDNGDDTHSDDCPDDGCVVDS
jgi:hypothetical protein